MLKKVLLALAMLLFLFFIYDYAQFKYAQFKNGNQIYYELTSSNPDEYIKDAEQNFAKGYITGVFDAYNGLVFLVPYEMTKGQVVLGQVLDIVKKYLEENPASRHEAAAILIGKALAEAFPIKK
jgi:hypothetical protein